MSLINCPECNHEVSDSALSCPNCEFNVKEWIKQSEESVEVQVKKRIETVNKSNRFNLKIIATFVLAVVVIACVGYILSSRMQNIVPFSPDSIGMKLSANDLERFTQNKNAALVGDIDYGHITILDEGHSSFSISWEHGFINEVSRYKFFKIDTKTSFDEIVSESDKYLNKMLTKSKQKYGDMYQVWTYDKDGNSIVVYTWNLADKHTYDISYHEENNSLGEKLIYIIETYF